MFRFADPQYLNWLWAVWGAFFVFLFIERSRAKKIQKIFGNKLGAFLTSSVSIAKKRWHFILHALALSCFVLALARPQLGSRVDEIKQSGIELIFALDVSNSMLAEDDKPSRLEHAKKELSRLLDKLTGDKVGIIAFAGSAALVAPLTSDYSALKMFLENLSPDSVSTQGTNFRAVIETALSAFDRGGTESETAAHPTRVVIFASDGEDNNDRNLKGVIDKAVNQGLRIFGLGFGTARGAPIPVRDNRGNLSGYKQDSRGQTVNSVPDEEFLTKISRWGNGGYYHATFEETEVMSLYNDLNRLQKSDFETKLNTTFDEKFQIPLLLGLLLALLEFWLGNRKKETKFWRGRFEVVR